METVSVRCNHCGAPLQVAEATRFVTCQFCHSSLEVKRTESALFTEEVAKIAEHTGKMAQSLEVIQLQNEIERLDREHAARDSASASNGSGAAGVIVLVLAILFGGFFAVTSARHGAPWIFPLFGGGFALLGIIRLAAVCTGNARGSGDKAAAAYDQRRGELARRLDNLTKG